MPSPRRILLAAALAVLLTHDVRPAGAQGAVGAAAAAPAPRATPVPQGPALQRLADSLANLITFVPVGESTFLAASRGKRLLLDIGRVDAEVRRDSARAAAYRVAVAKRAPVKVGAQLRLRAPWGEEDVTAGAIDTWNGRVVLRLDGSATLDSAAKGKNVLVTAAVLRAAKSPPRPDSCVRTLPAANSPLALRVTALRDSLERELRTGPQPLYPRLQKKMTIATSQVAGCFGTGRVALLVSLRAGNVEWVREKLVLIDTLGKATALRISDFRFRAHDLIHAVDANGDGIDDLATKASTEHAGATTLLTIDLKVRKASRFTAGFAWEDQ